MIELKPQRYGCFVCPECKASDVCVSDVYFPGIHVLADCRCGACGFEFLHDFPVGHGLDYPTAIGKKNHKIYEKRKAPWFSLPLFRSYFSKNSSPILIEKKQFKNVREVVVLNCLDTYYGHVLLKLFNAQDYKRIFGDLGLVLLIPKNFEWLLPEGAAEAWIIDLPLKELSQWFVRLDEFIKNEIKRFDKVYFGLAFSHPDPSKIDIADFTKVQRFDNASFFTHNPVISFMWREDRLWFEDFLGKLLFLICGKFKILGLFKSIFINQQNARIIKLARYIKKGIPLADFFVVGLGKKRHIPSFIHDLRKEKPDPEIEREWCKLYARSHLVVGVHGSNMLLPSALAASVIDILPNDRLGNILQDIALPYTKRKLVYLCRFVREYASLVEIGQIAISILKHYESFSHSTDDEYLQHGIFQDVKKWER